MRGVIVTEETRGENVSVSTCMCMCTCVCVCVCVCGPVRTDIRAVGTSPVVKPMPINVLSIFKHIDKVNIIFDICPDTVGKARFAYRGIGNVGGWWIKSRFVCIVSEMVPG